MEMIKKVISVIAALSVLFGTTVFAGVETAINDGDAISVWGTSSTGTEGEYYSIVLHDNYNSEAPALSAKGVWQGESGENGKWSINIPLADGISYEDLSLQYGDSLGVSQVFDVGEYEESIAFSVNKTGHIFFGAKNVEISANINNPTLNDHKYDICIRVYEEGKDELLYESKYSLTAPKETNREYTVPVDMTNSKLSYGMFEMQAAAVLAGETVSDDDFCNRIRFSVAKENKELNKKLGIHTQFGHGYPTVEVNTMLMKNAGFSGIRDYLAYSQCFTDGIWSEPTRYNGWVDDIKSNNLSQIIQLVTSDTGIPETAKEIEDYTKYAVAVAENLTKDGVYMYELGNELNWVCSAEVYANLLISVAPAIHNVDENVKMLAFASAGIDNFHSVNWMINVIDIIKSKGLNPHDYIDYITIHPYKPLNQWPEKAGRTCDCTYGTESYPELSKWEQITGKEHPDPTDTIKGDSSLVARMNNFSNRLKAVECDDIPIIATELGWYSYEGASSQNMCDTCRAKEVTSLSEKGQADYTLRATALLYNSIEQIYFHTLNNKPETAGTMEKNFGFTENWMSDEAEIPYEAKPVFIAMANFNSMLANAVLTEENVSGTTYDYVFTKNGKKIHMMWTTDESATTTFSESDIAVTDMYGNNVEVTKNESGVYTLNISGSPVYVEEIQPVPSVIITDANGNELKKIGDEKEFAAKVTLPVAAENSSVLICAVYCKDTLLGVTKRNVEAGQKTAVTDVLSYSGADKIKAFYWNNLSSINPVIPVTEMEK